MFDLAEDTRVSQGGIPFVIIVEEILKWKCDEAVTRYWKMCETILSLFIQIFSSKHFLNQVIRKLVYYTELFHPFVFFHL